LKKAVLEPFLSLSVVPAGGVKAWPGPITENLIDAGGFFHSLLPDALALPHPVLPYLPDVPLSPLHGPMPLRFLPDGFDVTLYSISGTKKPTGPFSEPINDLSPGDRTFPFQGLL
jgi:hypothetical protein